MAVNAWLKLDGIKGESLDSKHKDEIDLLSFSWGMAQPGSFGQGGGGDSLESLRIFEAAHRALSRLTPALLVVDDAQWADDLSLSLCHYLLRAALDTGQGLAVFVATRPSAASVFPEAAVVELPALERRLGSIAAMELR